MPVESLAYGGSIVEWGEDKWIITTDIDDLKAYKSASMVKSNNTLKFYSSSSSTLYQIPCIIGKSSISLETNKFLSIPADENLVVCPNNIDSSKIDENTRFILGGKVYSVIGIDNIETVGLLVIRIKEGQISDDDNLELSIANYYSNQIVYSMQLISNPIISLQSLNQTSKIELALITNGIVDTSPILSITNSNPSICTVDISTLIITCIGTGTSNIAINYHGQITVISVTGIGSISNNYAVSIAPSTTTSIKIGQQSIFESLFTNNGEPFLLYAYWTLLDDAETVSTDLATIISTSGTYNENIILKANSISKYGYVKLIVKDVSGNIVYKKRLQIKSLI